MTATLLLCLVLEVNISHSKLIKVCVFNQVRISHNTLYHNKYISHSACFHHRTPPSQRKGVAMGGAGGSDEPPFLTVAMDYVRLNHR